MFRGRTKPSDRGRMRTVEHHDDPPADVRYVFPTFPITRKQEKDNYGIYKSCELCLAYVNAPASGDPDDKIVL